MKAANDKNPIGTVYTLAEAAAHLRVSKRAFQDLIKLHPHYAKNGRVYLFSSNDITKIWDGMRCHSSSSGATVRNAGTFAAPLEANTVSRLRELTTRQRRKPSAFSMKLAS